MVRSVKIPLLLRVGFLFGFLTLGARAAATSPVHPLGNDTFEIVRQAGNGFVRDVDKLKSEALEQAAAYCAQQHKELKVLSATADKPKLMFTGYAKARVVFKALNADDPELHAPVATALPASSASYTESAPATSAAMSATPRTATDTLYSDLLKLDDLRKRGILTEEEFQAQKKKLLEK
jgi:hypothetical protein